MTIKQEYQRAARAARRYAREHGIEYRLKTVKRPTAASVRRVKKEHEAMKRAWQKQHDMRRGSVPKEEETAKRQRGESVYKGTTPVAANQPEQTQGFEVARQDAGREARALNSYSEAEQLIERVKAVVKALGSEGLPDHLPTVQAAKDMQNLLETWYENDPDGLADAVEGHGGEIAHLVEQGVSYKRKENKGKAYYLQFFSQVDAILQGATRVEIDATGFY